MMKLFLIGLMAVGFLHTSAFAGHCDKNVNRVLPPVPMAAIPTPAPTVVQQQVVMVPQTQIVDVERVVTEYVPQVRTEIVQEEVTVMVPMVQDVEVCQDVQPMASYVPQAAPQSTQQRSYGNSRLTDKQLALIRLQKAIDDMKIDGASRGEIRRAKRVLAILARRIDDSRTRGGY